MELPKINGEIDMGIVSDMIVSKIISELDCMSTANERRYLRTYVEEILKTINTK